MSASKAFKRVTHVIFDMDGVLLDTEILYTKATQNILDQYGKTFTWEVKTQMMGLHGQEMAERIVKIYDLPISAQEYYKQALEQYYIIMPECQLMPGTPERDSSRIAVQEMKLPMSVDKFQVEFRTKAHQYMTDVKFIPGAVTLVKHLHSKNIPIAVATSSSQESFNLKTGKHKDFFSLFNHIVCGGSDPEVKSGKPAPDIFLVCASRFTDKPSPEKCLVFEDAPNGILAAIGAGMQAVMIPDENVPPELRKNAHVVIDRLDRAPLEQFGLPSLNS
ncbi:unnamed protein product [Diabrotica balteata]|uniref:pseudouridine 5'-phosphatase n=1 Tax=Diabrotica balteata TaxID=107213 RepID=A0A9N9T5T7_DIABA|nr:unnamed protein product [Diabrotica balteata]